MTTPLNGTKTHPLTPHARMVLLGLNLFGPKPTQEINAGVVNRFHREALTETINLPSPYKTHKSKALSHERITDAGRAVLEQP